MDLIKALNEKQLQNDVPQVEVGDTVRVHVKVKEGARERVRINNCTNTTVIMFKR